VDITTPGNTALDIADYASKGGSMPKVVRDFSKRKTDPNQGPLAYGEARQFYSNASSRLSAEEAQRLAPQAKRLLSQFTSHLGNASRTLPIKREDYRTILTR
jgi:hypothetical protein